MAALEPPPSIAKTIRLLQEEFAARYRSKAALKPPVHITLSPPVYLDEEALGQYRSGLLEVSKNGRPFGITLRDFGFFKNNRVLFIRVSSSVQLSNLQKEFNDKLKHPDGRPYQPHITIGYRDLSAAIFEEIMKRYSMQSFNTQFTINSIRLWKHNGVSWETIEEFPLTDL